MSTISASTTSTTAYKVTADTTGTLVLQTGASPTTAMTIDTSQNVSVGTASTVGKFNVTGGTGTNVPAYFASSDANKTGLSYRSYPASNLSMLSTEWQTSTVALGFGLGGTEYGRFDTSGNWLVNLTSNSGYTSNYTPKAYIVAGSDATANHVLPALCLINSGNGNTTGYGVSLRFNMSTGEAGKYASIAATADGAYANSIGLAFSTTSFANGGVDNVTQRMYISGGGSIGAPSGTNIYNASDMRLKKNIQPLTGNLAKINSLEPVSFNWIENFCKEENDKTLYGFVAQTTQAVDEHLVEHFGITNKVFVNPGEENEVVVEDPLRVNEKFIIPMLVGAIQEQQALITQLQADVAALKGAA